MKKEITLNESQLRTSIQKIVRKYLRESIQQQKNYLTDYSEPVQDLLQYAYKCDILKDSLKERAMELENVIEEVNNVISEIIGNGYSKTFNADGDNVYLTIQLQQKELDTIKNYLLQHQNEYSEAFGELGDYEGDAIENVVSDAKEMLEFFNYMVLERKSEELNRYDLQSNNFKVTIEADAYSGPEINVSISCTFDWSNLEAIDRIGDI